MGKHTIQELWQWQSLPLSVKVNMTRGRIRDWIREYGEDGVYVSFSGGKDSTVLLDIVRQDYPNVKAAFCDTGLEYPEIRNFVKSFENVDWLKPKMQFKEVIKTYGYPFISKEVSECAYGAKKYLKSLTEKIGGAQHHTNNSIVSYADLESMRKPIGGGYDNKYRKLRGIGNYSKRQDAQPQGWEQPKTCANARNVRNGQTDKGEYP